MNRRSRTLILGAILLTCTAGVYLSARHFQFVDWDDYDEVTQNPLLHAATSAHLHQIWTQPYLRLYAPLTYSAWWVMSNLSMTADSPTAFHLFDVLLHLICVTLVYSILLKCVDCRVASFAGAALFALHPLQVESVAWIAETNNLLAAALSLAAIRIYLGVSDSSTRWWLFYGFASLCYVLALFAKPTAVVTPLIASILAIAIFRRRWQATLAELASWFLAAFCFSLIAHQAQYVSITHISDRPIVAIDALAFYLAKLVWPANLGIDYARTPATVLASKDWIIGAVVVIALSTLLYLARNKDRRLPTAGLVMLAGLLPILGFVPFAFQEWSTVADRFMYIATLGPALALAAILSHIRQSTALVVASAMGLILTYLTSAQLQMWRNTDELVKHTFAKNPDSVIAHFIAGAQLNRMGMPAEAARHYAAAIARDPSDPDFHYNLANALLNAGNYTEAIPEYQRAIDLGDSSSINAMNNMGVAYARLGRFDFARVMFNRVLAIDPKNPQATKNLELISYPVPTK
jgi:tetratricopeptide (TPR) repeat protein